MPMPSLDLAFLLPFLFVIAFLHSSVGLAGGSSYAAFMAVLGVPINIIPTISLSLNTLVSAIGSINFLRFKHFNWRLWLPLQLSALPCVYFGAMVTLQPLIFYLLLLVTLLFGITRIWFGRGSAIVTPTSNQYQWFICLALGGVIGFLSGSLGIGGGIYLIPCLLLFKLATPKHAAAVGVVFILVNSVIGLVSKWQIGQVNYGLITQMILPALFAVGIGGMFGSWFGAKLWSEHTAKKMLVLVMCVACALLVRKIGLIV